MSLIPNSIAAATTRAQGQLGRSRKSPLPCAWSADPTIDDCAKFQSWVLWGDNSSGEGPIAWVDGFKTAPNGVYVRGKAGMRQGDVVLFDWDGNGIGNHVEMCFNAPSASGFFTTIGANGSDTIAVGYRARNAYVLGYFRPAYGTAISTASTGGTTVLSSGAAAVISSLQEEPMDYTLILFNDGKGGQSYQTVSLFGRENVSGDYAKALAKYKSISFESIPQINANDWVAIQDARATHGGALAKALKS